MPLLSTALTLSPGLPGAGDRAYPSTVDAAAQEWCDALEAYVAGIIPASTTVSAAAATLGPALVGAFSVGGDVAALLETAFQTFAVTVGGGMAAAGFGATPPPGLLGFQALFAMPPPQSRAEGVERVALAIDTWMRTGVATLLAPPNTAQPWA